MSRKQKEEIVMITIRLPKQLHRAAKIKFFTEGTTFQKFFVTQLSKAVPVPEGAA
jgi:predicted DNA binding CopG/RHH family protein